MTREEAIKEIKTWDFLDNDEKEVLETLIPELQESEDEKIRKWIIDDIRYNMDNETLENSEYKKQGEKAIAWLEKQSKQKPVLIFPKFRVGDEIKTPNEESLTITKIDEKGYWSEDLFICDFDEECLWDLVEKKPDIKVEPKFKIGDVMRTLQEVADNIISGLPVVISIDEEYYHCTNELIAIKDQDDYEFPPMNRKQKHNDKPMFKVGDFIVNDYCFGKVIEITNDAYLLDTGQGIPFSCEHNAHLWTITQDAKDGDVLFVKPTENFGKQLIIFGGIDSNGRIKYYCRFLNNKFSIGGGLMGYDHKYFLPATKEQHDTLKKVINDAGYTFDFKKKELKKIEQQPSQWNISDYKTWQYIVSDVLTKHDGIGQYLDDGFCKKIAKYMQENWSKKPSFRQTPIWTEEDEKNWFGVM